jgi:hypothetical protein
MRPPPRSISGRIFCARPCAGLARCSVVRTDLRRGLHDGLLHVAGSSFPALRPSPADRGRSAIARCDLNCRRRALRRPRRSPGFVFRVVAAFCAEAEELFCRKTTGR